MYAYIYMNIHMCISICKYIKICIYMVNQKGRTITVECADNLYTYTCVYIYIHIYKYECIQLYTCVQIYQNMHVCR